MATSTLNDQLQRLLTNEQIAGYAFATHSGSVQFAFGCLSDALWRDGPETDEPCTGGVAQFVSAFRGPPATHFKLCGEHAVVVRSSDCSYFAISRQRRLGVSAFYLHSGLLVVAYSRAQQAAVPEVAALVQGLTWQLRPGGARPRRSPRE